MDKTFDFLVAIMYSQLIKLLAEMADNKFGGRLPYHTRFILDEFANIGKIPEFERKITTLRSREISMTIILQAKAHLEALYKDHANTIVSNCDSYLFLGGTDAATLKEISERLGKETIYTNNTSRMSYETIRGTPFFQAI